MRPPSAAACSAVFGPRPFPACRPARRRDLPAAPAPVRWLRPPARRRPPRQDPDRDCSSPKPMSTPAQTAAARGQWTIMYSCYGSAGRDLKRTSGHRSRGGEMPSIAERVSALEERVEWLAEQSQHATDAAVVAIREALTVPDAQQRNVALLNALRKTQMEQGLTLDEHSRTLAGHTRLLAQQGQILAEHSRVLARHGQTLDEHSRTLAGHGQRMDSIDAKLGMLTVGVHTIESMLRRLMDAEGLS